MYLVLFSFAYVNQQFKLTICILEIHSNDLQMKTIYFADIS